LSGVLSLKPATQIPASTLEKKMNCSMKTRSAMTPLKSTVLASAMLLCAAIVPSVHAQTATDPNTSVTTTTTTTTKAAKLDRTDAHFLKEAAEGGLTEVDAGKAALGKATHPDVKAFAQMLIDDHTKANAELAGLAAGKNVKLPTEPSMVDKAKLKVLGMREAANFDKHFIKTLGVDAHEDTIKRFEKEIKDGKDADIKAYATKTLPTLQHHLQMAKDLHAKLDPKK
jgi:putative membrane protein